MRRQVLFCAALLATALAHGQPAADDWNVTPAASDDRFSNPKSKLYAGPNGWYNAGEVRAQVGAKPVGVKAGLNYLTTPAAFVLASSGQLHTLMLDFGTATPAPGTYQLAAKPDAAARKVMVSYADVSNKQILEWKSAGAGAAGTVTVTQAHGFVHFKARGLKLVASGLNHQGELKQPMTLGMEGAVKLD